MWVRVKNLSKNKKNGRIVYKALFEKYLVREMVNYKVADIKHRLENSEWVKDNCNWDFPKFIDMHV